MRSLSTGVVSALTSQIVRPSFFVSLQFTNETVYMWSGVGTVTWNSQNWLGVGKLGSVSALEEGSAVEAKGISLTLTGLDSEMMTDCLQYLTTSGTARVYLAFFDASGNIIASPQPSWIGLMDQPVIDYGADKATINIAVESRLSDLNRARGGRYTDQDQRARHPNDNSLLYVAQIQEMYVNWHS